MPTAEQAIIDAFDCLNASFEADDRCSLETPRRVVALFVDRFAWHGRHDLDTDVMLDDHIDEDALVDALAKLLWDARHAGRVSGDTGAPAMSKRSHAAASCSTLGTVRQGRDNTF